jgi:hypothetical protein
MRKISNEAKQAFEERRRFKKGNTKVVAALDVCIMYLFGHEIIREDHEGFKITIAGHNTRTTRDRLSAFINVRSIKGQLVINNKYPWDGKWLNLTDLENGNNKSSL